MSSKIQSLQHFNPSQSLQLMYFTYYDKNLDVEIQQDSASLKYEKGSIEVSGSVRKLLKISCSDGMSDFSAPAPKKFRLDKRAMKKYKWNPADYAKSIDKIYSRIRFLCNTSVIVWIPLVDVRVELVHTLVSKFGEIVIIHDRWIRDEQNPLKESWGGVLVVYATQSQAAMAASEIPKKHR